MRNRKLLRMFWLFPVQLLLIPLLLICRNWYGIIAGILLVFFADMGLSLHGMALFTRKTKKATAYLQEFMPYLLCSFGVGVMDYFVYTCISHFFIQSSVLLLWLGICLALLLCGALLTLILGVARTMLYHDDTDIRRKS